MRAGKRAFDAASAALGLILLSPVLAAAALAVKLGSRGPVLFRQHREGRQGRIFSMVKFRSMCVNHSGDGPGITVSGDSRVTPVGRFLRRYKIDEFPQLWNVVRGEMSLVGPRPELPRYVARYSPAQREVLSVRPGITDPASLYYRHEEEILAASANPERCYADKILPDKLTRNLDYIRQISFAGDMRLIIQTLRCVFAKPRRSSGLQIG